MKTRLNITNIILVLLALFGSLHSASAYYDPSVQRWLNRDPIAEREGINLYCCVKNDSINRVDPDGRGTWTFNIEKDPRGGMNVDVFYTLDDHELRCCSEAAIVRYIGGGNGTPWNQDGDIDEGTWDIVNHAAHAPGDEPEGLGLKGTRFRFPATQNFRWEVRCTKGRRAGRLQASAEKRYHTSAHLQGSYYWAFFDDIPPYLPTE